MMLFHSQVMCVCLCVELFLDEVLFLTCWWGTFPVEHVRGRPGGGWDDDPGNVAVPETG